jgi:hypothetical protein
MKIGLFLALLVLLASTNVFGEEGRGKKGHPTKIETGTGETVETSGGDSTVVSDGGSTVVSGGGSTVVSSEKVVTGGQVVGDSSQTVVTTKTESQPTETISVVRHETQPVTVTREETKKIKVLKESIVPVTTITKETKNVTVIRKETLPVTVEHKTTKNVTVLREEEVPVKVITQETRPGTVVTEEVRKVQTGSSAGVVVNQETRPGVVVSEEVKNVQTESGAGASVVVSQETTPAVVVSEEVKQTHTEHGSDTNIEVKPSEAVSVTKTEEHPVQPDSVELTKNETVRVDHVNETRPTEDVLVSEKSVHVRGSIVLVKHRTSVVDSVQYDLDGGRLINGGRPIIEPRLPFALDFLARPSRITLYVSTSKTTDPKLAFAQFPIKYTEDHFPISFNVNVDLPNQQLGLLESADITLYFFVYIHNLETRIDTFIPAGTSQILLQGTNRLVQKLDVYVRASGIEVVGLLRGRFSERFIRPGTSFQILILSEQNLIHRHTTSFESVAQLTITNVPAMFPVPFSLLVQYQMLQPNTKYYAIAYVYENGIRQMLNQEPIYVINEHRALVSSQIIFSVVPSPFILRGVVTRSMPGSFFLQPHSSLILRLHEIGSDSRDIIFKLPDMLTLPQVFQINITEAIRFDASKNYDIRALITDERNNIYMASLQPIPLLDELSRLIVPVDDLLYYVQARLHASSNQYLNYIPGSTAQIFVTESPESPTQPIVALRIDTVVTEFREFSLQVPATAIQRGRNYYLVMMIENNGIITHVSKTLLISNNQPPPLLIELPVLSLNLITGVIFDVENRPAQWSSSSYASLYLLDDKAEDADKAIVQVWKIHLENDFPVRFEIQVDFSRLRPTHVYRLQGAIENGRNVLEYKPAGSVLTLNPNAGIISDVRIPVHNVKTFQLVSGLVYINDLSGPLPEHGEVIVQLSSSPSLTYPSIIEEIRIKVDGRTLPVDFTMKLALNKIDINSVYYFLVRYVVRDTVIIPSSQAFAFAPRNEATIVLTLSKTPQIPITGQITSTGSPLLLPDGSTLHLYITDNLDHTRPMIYSEVYLKATSNSLYEFTMNIDSVILQKKIPLYLRADILFEETIILSIPRPALLQITPGGEWNINLVVDLPTLIIGQITSMSRQEAISGEFDVLIQILERGTTNIVHVSRLRLSANLPQKFRIELENELFFRYRALQARALIKNCKEQILFETGGVVDIHTGLNVRVDLPVVLTDPKKLTEIQTTVNEIASIYTGVWRLSVTGTVTDTKVSVVNDIDKGFILTK